MIAEKIIAEIKQIPAEKLEQLHNLIYCFRMAILNEKTILVEEKVSFSARWQGRLPLNESESLDYLKKRYQL